MILLVCLYLFFLYLINSRPVFNSYFFEVGNGRELGRSEVIDFKTLRLDFFQLWKLVDLTQQNVPFFLAELTANMSYFRPVYLGFILAYRQLNWRQKVDLIHR
jgi:hypothetical protein